METETETDIAITDIKLVQGRGYRSRYKLTPQ